MKLSQACQLGSAIVLGFTTFASALPNPFAVEPRQATSTRVADAACTNGPNTRSCWRTGYSIVTDFDNKLPNWGKEVTYNLEITNTTMAPDGVERLVMAINKQYRKSSDVWYRSPTGLSKRPEGPYLARPHWCMMSWIITNALQLARLSSLIGETRSS